ncbi:MAG: hypothetical protein LBU89_05210 [Fibromonadaceae bacterium]|jgi:hypothetical protein|nr:hypothetical protein [Fibromonadaceae bacterium]
MNHILCKANLGLLALLCFALASCDLNFWKEPSPVIAEVENSRLRIKDLKETATGDSLVSKEEWIRRIEYWVNFEIMHREALKRGLHKDSATQRLIKNAERKILVDRLKLSLDSAVAVESDNELQEYYEKNKELFRIDSVSYVPFSEVSEQILSVVLSKKRLEREKKWLTETKNLYSIEVYPQYLDLLEKETP